jgi:transcriptional regulator with XRE-family HTH domain
MMTPVQLTRARQRLGLTLEQMARMLGYDGVQSRSQVHNLETGRRELRPAQRRLVEAYLAGYRPPDWPGLS